MLQSRQKHFPQGQFVVEFKGKVVGYCDTFRIDEATALAPHTWAQITGGETAATLRTHGGPIGVMICYDAEFPEVARHLTDQGALILFVPFCTDVREGYLRVRYCSQARAIENQRYVVLSGNVGNLPGVNNFDIQYGQSCILTPSDCPFAREGVAADPTPNIETVLFAELRLDSLARARIAGSVQNLKDRRFDLYETRWLPQPR